MSCDTHRRQLWKALNLNVQEMEDVFRAAKDSAQGREISDDERATWEEKTRALLRLFDRFNVPRPVHGVQSDLPRLSSMTGYAALFDLLDQRGLLKTIGLSFFRGTLQSVSQARAIGESPDGWAKHERIFRKYLKDLGLEDEVEWTLGFWGGPEPSFNAWVKGAREKVVELAKRWGRDFDQEAVALLFPNPNGEGGKLKWDFGRELSDEEWDSFLNVLHAFNVKLGPKYDDYFGVTIRGSRTIEYWYKDEVKWKQSENIIKMAIEKTKLPAVFDKEEGYDFILLKKERGDY
jgi:hypothetical protein